MKERGEMAQSEAPKVSDYEEFFAEQLTKAQSVVHISMAESVSPGFANALEASKAFDNVMVIDSGQLSSGMGTYGFVCPILCYRRNGSRGYCAET